MTNIQQDLRYPWRTLVQMPGLASVIILSIALGVAAITTVFSVANGLLWGLLPTRDPGRLVIGTFHRRGSHQLHLSTVGSGAECDLEFFRPLHACENGRAAAQV